MRSMRRGFVVAGVGIAIVIAGVTGTVAALGHGGPARSTHSSTHAVAKTAPATTPPPATAGAGVTTTAASPPVSSVPAATAPARSVPAPAVAATTTTAPAPAIGAPAGSRFGPSGSPTP